MHKLVIGLDISKQTLDATILFLEDSKKYHDAFLNKLFGFKQLLQWSKKHAGGLPLFFCIENTGHYNRSLCEFLQQNNLNFALVNAAEIKSSMGLRREKSDKKDSEMIAYYGLKFPEKMYENTLLKEELLQLQLLLSQRHLLQEKELAFQRNLKLLSHCLPDNKQAKSIVKQNTKHRKYFQKSRKETEQKIEDYIQSIPALKQNFDLLISIPGIGRIIAQYTLVQTQNFEMISDARKFSCYCGVAPFKNESGTSIRKGTRVSFHGHKRLKRILNFGAMNAVKYEPELKAYYQRKVEEGKNKMSVLNAVRNKLIHRMFATIKRGTPYVVRPVY